MRFIHIADMHFDNIFSSSIYDKDFDEKRRIEQRDAFRKIIDYIKEFEIDYLFIAGDFYEEKYIRKSTIDYINNLFKSIPKTKIFITPGNHDPNIKGSFYDTYKFNSNVKVFKNSEIEHYSDEKIDVYGVGFTDYYMNKDLFSNFKLNKNLSKPQILIMHADLNGTSNELEKTYNPINEKYLDTIGFDYVALGHIHKNNYYDGRKIVYPGSTISLGFDELGKHGMVVGEFQNKDLVTSFVPVDKREFVEKEIVVDEILDKEDLIYRINEIELDSKEFCKVVLKGKRKFIINEKELMNFVNIDNILKIKDETVLGYDLEKIMNENTLQGRFVRCILKRANSLSYTDEELEKAIEIGLSQMQ